LGELGQLREVIWCQEEPSNMGAYAFLHPIFHRLFRESDRPLTLRWVARAESASPATGSPKAHQIEQDDLLTRAFTR
jgi:2-oxoglutarate dehydrogenase E1 component